MGRHKGHVPVRTCIICRSRCPKKDLLRLSTDDKGNLVKDISGRMQGRGAYVCKAEACQAKLLKRKGLNRIFRTDKEITLSPEFDTYE